MLSIQINNLCKKYYIEYRKRISIRDSVLNYFQGRLRKSEFWALKDIDLSVKQGETLGVIGRNGSGKTTLLRLLCGITHPSKGSIDIKGKVVSLLELGAGFEGDLTGRENIYLNSAILGVPNKKIRKEMDSIIDFADIGNFIDAPLRTYSAGMCVRLGFSIICHIDFDVMAIDEIISIGDSAFQDKCLDKLREFRKNAKTLIFVSHYFDLMSSLCDKIIILDKGRNIFSGQPKEAINEYESLLK